MALADKAVEEAFGAFRDFLYRDAFYIVGGISIMLSFFYAIDRMEIIQPERMSDTAYVVVLGYVVGYVAQEMISILGFVGTTYRRPSKFIRRLGKRFAPAEDWDGFPDVTEIDIQALRLCVDAHMSETTRKRNQRTINLKQVCSTMGAAGFISCFFLLMRALRNPQDGGISWAIFFGTLLLTLSLFIMNAIKNAQQRNLELGLNRKCTECLGSARRSNGAA